MGESSANLLVEILEGDLDWGRQDYLRAAHLEGRRIRVLALGDARPSTQIDSGHEVWLDQQLHAEGASEKLRVLYPQFLYEFGSSSGLFDVTVLDGRVSLYWFMPVSEMSLMRNPLIDKLYALLVLEQELQTNSYSQLILVCNDPLLEPPVRELAGRNGATFQKLHIAQSTHSAYKRRISLVMRWCGGLLRDAALWLLFRPSGKRVIEDLPRADHYAVGLTIYPTLWAQIGSSGGQQNLALGDWPDVLKQHGIQLIYAAIPSMRLKEVIREVFSQRTRLAAEGIVFVHSLVGLSDILSAYLRTTWGRKLSGWLRQIKTRPVLFNHLNVNALIYREFSQEIWSPALVQCLMIVRAASNLISQLSSVACAVYPFEFQPIEKAFTVGAKFVNQDLPTLGLQTSIIGRAHLGYRFLRRQVTDPGEFNPPLAPMPDYVAAYGTITGAALTERLGPERVSLIGPVRYPYLRMNSEAERRHAEIEWRNRLNLHAKTDLILLALPSIRREAQCILEWAIEAAKDLPETYFLIRFHYWAVMTKELERIAARAGFDRYHIPSAGLHELLLASHAIVTGTSSVGVEGMISGCMPVCYRTTGRYDFGRVQDVSEGAYFFSNLQELQASLQECLGRGTGYDTRRAQWPLILGRLCYGLDGNASARLYHSLVQRGVFEGENTKVKVA